MIFLSSQLKLTRLPQEQDSDVFWIFQFPVGPPTKKKDGDISELPAPADSLATGTGQSCLLDFQLPVGQPTKKKDSDISELSSS